MVLSPPKKRAAGGSRGSGGGAVRRQATDVSNVGPCSTVGDASVRDALSIREAEASARDYSAPWKLDIIADSVISGLLYQVNRHLGGNATALQDVPTTPGRRPAVAKEDWSTVPLVQRVSEPVMKWENEQALEQLRARLLSRFPTLTSVFRGIDHNKDATLTFGELSAGLQKLGFRGLVPKELRMAFGAMDIEGKGYLSLGDWVRGTTEDELSAVPEKPTARQVSRPSVPIHQRPAWSNRQVPVSVAKSTTFERHLDEHPLPPPPPRASPEQLSSVHPESAHLSVLARSEDHIQRRCERLEAKRAEEDLAVARQKAARPKMSPKSHALVQGTHSKPWEERPHDLAKTEPIYKKRVQADMTERQEQVARAHTFRPQLSPKSHAMFDQFEDNGKPWHERLYGRHERLAAIRSGSPHTCRMALLRKKMTKDFLADHFRERRPQLSATSRRRVRSAEGGRRPGIDVHSRLHMNLVRGKTCHSDGEDEGDDDSFVLTGMKASRSVSFLYRPGPRAPQVPDLNLLGAKSDGSAAAAAAGGQGEATITTAGGLPSDTSGSPVGGSGGGGGEWSDASMLAGSPAGGMQQTIESLEATIKPPSGPCTRMVASPDITALLSAIAPYARPMGDSSDDDDDEDAH